MIQLMELQFTKVHPLTEFNSWQHYIITPKQGNIITYQFQLKIFSS